MIGFPGGTPDGHLLWHIDSPSGDAGRVTGRLCKMLADSDEAPRADTMWVLVHFNTMDINEAQLALSRLASADIVLQWPRPDLSSVPAPQPTSVRRHDGFCSTERFRLYLPPARVQAMFAPTMEPSDPVASVHAILDWAHNALNGSTAWSKQTCV